MIRCGICGARFERGEVFFRKEDSFACTECADGLCAGDILILINGRRTRDILTALGYEKDFL